MRGGRGRLDEFAKARSGVGESPGGQLDMKIVEGSDYGLGLSGGEHLARSDSIECDSNFVHFAM